jgi:hypothetical protein
MKRLLLIALIFTAPAFAQEEVEKEERQVEIRMESLGGGVEVAAGGSANEMIAAFSDKSIWSVSRGGNTSRESLYTYCWVDEDNEPHCKEVKSE